MAEYQHGCDNYAVIELPIMIQIISFSNSLIVVLVVTNWDCTTQQETEPCQLSHESTDCDCVIITSEDTSLATGVLFKLVDHVPGCDSLGMHYTTNY